MSPEPYPIIDMHCHIGLIGDTWPKLGRMSDDYRRTLTYQIFLLYGRLKSHDVTDQLLRERTLEVIADSQRVDKVVCLALDPVYTASGKRREDLSNMWVHNNYVLELRRELPDKILFGASVHPYDPKFEDRVREVVDQGAVLLKWLPSAQQIDLSDSRARKAMRSLATAGPGGKALPLLLHVGPEYAIPSTDPRTTSHDYLDWTTWDGIVNWFRFSNKWHVPDLDCIHDSIEHALHGGAVIIFAHCGAPYVFSGWAGRAFEHSETHVVQNYLLRTARNEFPGRCLADVSAFATPFRKNYFEFVKALPDDLLLYGSDFPTPIFEISADFEENCRDFRAVLDGHLDRVIIPQDNLLDVNMKEMMHFFDNHRLFTNFSRLRFDGPG